MRCYFYWSRRTMDILIAAVNQIRSLWFFLLFKIPCLKCLLQFFKNYLVRHFEEESLKIFFSIKISTFFVTLPPVNYKFSTYVFYMNFKAFLMLFSMTYNVHTFLIFLLLLWEPRRHIAWLIYKEEIGTYFFFLKSIV